MRSRHLVISVGFGLMAFIAVWMVHAILLTVAANTTDLSDRAQVIGAIGYAFWPLSFAIGGYTAGRLFGHRGFLAGGVLGVFVVILGWSGTLLLAGLQIIPGIDTSLPIGKALQNVATAAVGGAIADLWPTRKAGR